MVEKANDSDKRPNAVSLDDAISYVNPSHPRAFGVWPQYFGLNTRLSGRIFFSDVINPRTRWEFYDGKTADVVDLNAQTPENYHHTHNHYQLIMSEVQNYLAGTNVIPIWGDGAALHNGSGAGEDSLPLDLCILTVS